MMAAELKSHVLRRDEKGYLGIPFKRLLGAAIGGASLFMSFRLFMPTIGIPAGIVGFIACLILTGQQGGLPLYTRLLLQLRGSLIITAVRQPNSLSGKLAKTLELPIHLVNLHSEQVFAPIRATEEADLTEWETYATPLEEGVGLVFVREALPVTAILGREESL